MKRRNLPPTPYTCLHRRPATHRNPTTIAGSIGVCKRTATLRNPMHTRKNTGPANNDGEHMAPNYDEQVPALRRHKQLRIASRHAGACATVKRARVCGCTTQAPTKAAGTTTATLRTRGVQGSGTHRAKQTCLGSKADGAGQRYFHDRAMPHSSDQSHRK